LLILRICNSFVIEPSVSESNLLFHLTVSAAVIFFAIEAEYIGSLSAVVGNFTKPPCVRKMVSLLTLRSCISFVIDPSISESNLLFHLTVSSAVISELS
jgi:hypothetical protein